MKQILLLSLFLFLLAACAEQEERGTTEVVHPNSALAEYVEDMNSLLPQRLDETTYFDSLSAGVNHLTYYYSVHFESISGTPDPVQEDSLMRMAEGRVPCTLWRPLFMQGVDVSFVYLTPENKEILRFTREQEACR